MSMSQSQESCLLCSAGSTAVWSVVLFGAACSQEPLDDFRARQTPPLPEQAAAPAGVMQGQEAAFERFPLGDGLVWTYRFTDALGEVRQEAASMRRVAWPDSVAGVGYELAWSPPGEDTERYELWSVQGEEVRRVREVELSNGQASLVTEYAPGFPRFSAAWSALGQVQDIVYTRTETNELGEQEVRERSQRFTILETGNSVSVPAGTYDGCVRVGRGGDGDPVENWFCAGVGLVRQVETDTGALQELVAFVGG